METLLNTPLYFYRSVFLLITPHILTGMNRIQNYATWTHIEKEKSRKDLWLRTFLWKLNSIDLIKRRALCSHSDVGQSVSTAHFYILKNKKSEKKTNTRTVKTGQTSTVALLLCSSSRKIQTRSIVLWKPSEAKLNVVIKWFILHDYFDIFEWLIDLIYLSWQARSII